jgi:Phytanoyl-CoA dioxygenase (PhyH)
MIFRSRKRTNGATALAERGAAEVDPRPLEAISDEIEELQRENRAARDRDLDRKLVRLRHRAGVKLLAEAGARPDQPAPADRLLSAASPGSLPDLSPSQLTPELLRAGMLRDGCVLIRGVVDRDEALGLAADIDRAFEERATLQSGGKVADPYYEEFDPEAGFSLAEREWVRDGGGVLAADCPKVMFDLIDVFDRAGLRSVVNEYLGERAAMSMNKSTLRRARPDDGGAWHQDGAFMGDVRALNIWLSLSHCGDDAPGLDIVPRRLDHIVPTGTDDAVFDWSVAPAVATEVAGETGTVRPIFEPGDVVLFDELCLHSTALDPSMTKTRYAVESWFFGPSAFPSDYVPLAF